MNIETQFKHCKLFKLPWIPLPMRFFFTFEPHQKEEEIVFAIQLLLRMQLCVCYLYTIHNLTVHFTANVVIQ